MMIDSQKLWEPYSKSKCTVEQFSTWCIQDAVRRGVDRELAAAAVQLTFLELANGKTFSTDGCSCGCELTNAHSEICHYTVRKALEMDGERRAEQNRLIEEHLNAAILRRIEEDNAAYTAEMMPPKRSWKERLKGWGARSDR